MISSWGWNAINIIKTSGILLLLLQSGLRFLLLLFGEHFERVQIEALFVRRGWEIVLVFQLRRFLFLLVIVGLFEILSTTGHFKYALFGSTDSSLQIIVGFGRYGGKAFHTQ
uniref:(northern house mosquito) hypothetical protein n=1 Tax=Culex pipiens TaxID=7175 RepID=A0A8D8B3F4_CULPI